MELKVGMELPVEVLIAWCKAGDNHWDGANWISGDNIFSKTVLQRKLVKLLYCNGEFAMDVNWYGCSTITVRAEDFPAFYDKFYSKPSASTLKSIEVGQTIPYEVLKSWIKFGDNYWNESKSVFMSLPNTSLIDVPRHVKLVKYDKNILLISRVHESENTINVRLTGFLEFWKVKFPGSYKSVFLKEQPVTQPVLSMLTYDQMVRNHQEDTYNGVLLSGEQRNMYSNGRSGCSCHTGNPPCSWCTASLSDDPEEWPDEEKEYYGYPLSTNLLTNNPINNVYHDQIGKSIQVPRTLNRVTGGQKFTGSTVSGKASKTAVTVGHLINRTISN